MRPATVAILVVGAGACAGSGAPRDTDPGVDSAPAEPLPSSFVRELRVNAYVAWDAEAGVIVDPVVDGRPSASVLVLGLSGPPDGALAECSVTIGLSALSVGRPEEGHHWQLEVPPGTPDRKVVATDCPDVGYDDAQYPGSDAATYWGGLPWSLRVVDGALDPRLSTRLFGDVDLTYVVQGGLAGEEPYGLTRDPDLAPLAYWRGWAMLGGTVATVGKELVFPLAASDIGAGPEGTLPTGYYVYDDLVVTPLPDRLVRGVR